MQDDDGRILSGPDPTALMSLDSRDSKEQRWRRTIDPYAAEVPKPIEDRDVSDHLIAMYWG